MKMDMGMMNMIEVKRNCSSSIRDYDGSASLTFGSFTIKFTDAAYHSFKYLMQIREDEAQQLLASIITVGLNTLLSAGLYR